MQLPHFHLPAPSLSSMFGLLNQEKPSKIQTKLCQEIRLNNIADKLGERLSAAMATANTYVAESKSDNISPALAAEKMAQAREKFEIAQRLSVRLLKCTQYAADNEHYESLDVAENYLATCFDTIVSNYDTEAGADPEPYTTIMVAAHLQAAQIRLKL